MSESNAVKGPRTLQAVSGAYPRLAKISEKYDSWQNVLTGLGTLRDKRTAGGFLESPRLTDEQLENLYHGDDMAARVCDAIPEEAFRQGFEVKVEAEGDDADEQGKAGDPDPDEPKPSALNVDEALEIGSDVTLAMQDLDTVRHFTDAGVWARCFGGSIIVPGVDDGTPPERAFEPLRENSIRSVDFLNVIDKRHMTPITWYTDPLSPKFGRPETYLITPEVVHASGNTARSFAGAQAVVIHETRLIIFDGTRVTNKRRQRNDGFADSVLQRLFDALRDFNQTFDGIAHVMTDYGQGVFKLKDLISMIAAGDTETILKRFKIMDQSRSTVRAIALDAELEEFTREAVSLASVAEVLDKFAIRLSAAARMPVTILMGQSPAGMDATGVSDRQIWFDVVRGVQQFEFEPALARLAELIMMSKDGPTGGSLPENWRIDFPSLWQLTPKEQSEQREAQSRTDKNYIDAQVLLPEEVALSRFQAQGYSDDTTIDLTLRKEVLEFEKETALERAASPPEPPPGPVPPGDPNDDDDRQDALRFDRIEKRGEKYVLIAGDGTTLGSHDTQAEAEAQERAIKAREGRRDASHLGRRRGRRKKRKKRKDGHLARKHVHAFMDLDGREQFTSAEGEHEDHTHTGNVDGTVINFSREETGVPHFHTGLVSGRVVTTGGSEDPGVAVDDQD